MFAFIILKSDIGVLTYYYGLQLYYFGYEYPLLHICGHPLLSSVIFRQLISINHQDGGLILSEVP